MLCIIGPSGSGKSTFLRCINHLEKIDGGRLTVDGELVGYREHSGRLYELRDREVGQRRAQIGMVFQHFNLFPHMTALENVTVGPVKVKGEEKAAGRQAGQGAVGTGRAGRQGRCLPKAALRWPAAKGSHRPRLSVCSPS